MKLTKITHEQLVEFQGWAEGKIRGFIVDKDAYTPPADMIAFFTLLKEVGQIIEMVEKPAPRHEEPKVKRVK